MSHLIYFSFAALSATVELYLFLILTKAIGHLLPSPIDMKDYDERKSYSKLEQLVFQVK